MTVIPKLTPLRQFDTCRLIPSRFADLEDSVLAPLAEDDDMLRDLFDLDNATNERLRAESGVDEEHGACTMCGEFCAYKVMNERRQKKAAS